MKIVVARIFKSVELLAEIRHACKHASSSVVVDMLARRAIEEGFSEGEVAEAAGYSTDVPCLWEGVRCDQCNKRMTVSETHVWVRGLFPVCSKECAEQLCKAFEGM